MFMVNLLIIILKTSKIVGVTKLMKNSTSWFCKDQKKMLNFYIINFESQKLKKQNGTKNLPHGGGVIEKSKATPQKTKNPLSLLPKPDWTKKKGSIS